ncbi:unnamed protein product [Protopolystoma xenopodis]|uniref:Uncharacterized protein n=1 Tax=Protopolystoma xenopodis TaxID=117903 RepID=A0A448WR78_9PLAT|nr:unnamed protein product [Protopolystoma xenopodis]
MSGRGALFLAATTLPALFTPSVGLMTLSPSPVGRQAQVVEYNRGVYVGTRGARPSAGQRQTSRSEEETNDMLLFGQSVVMAEEPAPS